MRKPPPQKRNGQARAQRALDGEVMDLRTGARVVGCTEKQARARIARGQLPYRRWGGRIVMLRSELLQFLSGLSGVTAAEALENMRGREP